MSANDLPSLRRAERDALKATAAARKASAESDATAARRYGSDAGAFCMLYKDCDTEAAGWAYWRALGPDASAALGAEWKAKRDAMRAECKCDKLAADYCTLRDISDTITLGRRLAEAESFLVSNAEPNTSLLKGFSQVCRSPKDNGPVLARLDGKRCFNGQLRYTVAAFTANGFFLGCSASKATAAKSFARNAPLVTVPLVTVPRIA